MKDDLKEDPVGLLKEFDSGDREVMYDVAYGRQRFLTEVEVLGRQEQEHTDLKWESRNIWGIPNLIKVRGDTVCLSLYLPEHAFKSEEECRADMKAMDFQPDRDLESFVLGIVADG